MSLISQSAGTVTLDRAVSIAVLVHHVVFSGWATYQILKKDDKPRNGKLATNLVALTAFFLLTISLREVSLVMSAFGIACEASGLFGAICSFIFRCSYWLLNILRLGSFNDHSTDPCKRRVFLCLMVVCFFVQLFLAVAGKSFTMTHSAELNFCQIDATNWAIIIPAADLFFNISLSFLFYYLSKRCYTSFAENADLYHSAVKGVVLNVSFVVTTFITVVLSIVSDVIFFSSLAGIVAFWCFMLFNSRLDGIFKGFCGCFLTAPAKINGAQHLEEDPQQDNAGDIDLENGQTETR